MAPTKSRGFATKNGPIIPIRVNSKTIITLIANFLLFSNSFVTPWMVLVIDINTTTHSLLMYLDPMVGSNIP